MKKKTAILLCSALLLSLLSGCGGTAAKSSIDLSAIPVIPAGEAELLSRGGFYSELYQSQFAH